MSNAPALAVLEPKLDELERKANALLQVVNELRTEDGLPPRPPSGGEGFVTPGASGSAGATVSQIRPDTFYGKKMQTAIREYLEMRKAAGIGPATPRQIYEAITAGGYKFEAKDETTALVGMRALLRKRTAFFHKLPNGSYGLTNWYPDAKKPKASVAETDADDDDEEEPNPAKEMEAAASSAKKSATAA
jgi:hypothetical protein